MKASYPHMNRPRGSAEICCHVTPLSSCCEKVGGRVHDVGMSGHERGTAEAFMPATPPGPELGQSRSDPAVKDRFTPDAPPARIRSPGSDERCNPLSCERLRGIPSGSLVAAVGDSERRRDKYLPGVRGDRYRTGTEAIANSGRGGRIWDMRPGRSAVHAAPYAAEVRDAEAVASGSDEDARIRRDERDRPHPVERERTHVGPGRALVPERKTPPVSEATKISGYFRVNRDRVGTAARCNVGLKFAQRPDQRIGHQ